MEIDGYEFMADVVAKFFNTIRISGWFRHPEDDLSHVSVVGASTVGGLSQVDPKTGTGADAIFNRFSIQILQTTNTFPEAAELQFVTRSGWTHRVRLVDLCLERSLINNVTGVMAQTFATEVSTSGGRLLDIGGRNRSTTDSSAIFSGAERTVLDIHPGENVTVVGDAHRMGDLFPPEHFDFIFSVSVFEHLMMPWAVVPQMNLIMRTGGVALIATHQTLGVHDMPWDFWRFSDRAWDALFNRFTGFEIIEAGMSVEQYILPLIYRPEKAGAEQSVGLEVSAVYVRKIGPCQMSWNLAPSDIVTTMYPEGTEPAPKSF